jgi:ubiquinone/menaquinone biosynthesis C-methylase UbiE
MNYLRLNRRVAEASAVDPKLLTGLYTLITRAPVVRAVHRRFVAGALGQGVSEGLGLDLGTGPGTVALEMARQRAGLRMVGLDLAAHMVERAQQHAVRAGLQGLWPQADAHRLPFADDTFDLVVSSFALHHWEDPVRIFDEIARVLKPDGQYYIADVCREVNLVQRMFAYASIPAISLPFGSYRGYGGYYESVRAAYTRAEAERLLAESALPQGQVTQDGTCLVPVLSIASRREG